MAGYKRLVTVLSIFVVSIFSINWTKASDEEKLIISAVFDREEDQNFAVLLDEENGKEWVVNRHQMPVESMPGQWFNIFFNESHIHHIELSTEFKKRETLEVKYIIEKIFK